MNEHVLLTGKKVRDDRGSFPTVSLHPETASLEPDSGTFANPKHVFRPP